MIAVALCAAVTLIGGAQAGNTVAMVCAGLVLALSISGAGAERSR